MPLEPGRMLAHYRLVARIGEGGMGVVWRAHDSTLDRDVAIKVLPEAYARDPERVARFEREARVLASLQHPNIAAVHGAHAVDGLRFIALEFVPGEDLAERLTRGPIEIPEVLVIARQVVVALEAAHEHGVIHRDLKPANVKLAPDGTVKLLDFGLARALEGEGAAGSDRVLSQSPTLTDLHTQPSVILGTAAYMSPEQARGRAVDKRADIWSLGVLLYELLTGRRLFEGETVSDTLAAVLKTDPDWSRLPAATPHAVRELLRRCLERDPKRRLRDVGEARLMLERADVPEAGVTSVVGMPGWRAAALLVAAGLAIGVLGGLALGRLGASREAAAPPRRFRVGITADGRQLQAPLLSPNGRLLAASSRDTIWLHDLDELDPRRFAVVPSIEQLFWSPDSRWLGCIAGGQMKRIAIGSGDPQTLCALGGPTTGGMGAAWLTNGTIVFSRGDSSGLWSVPEEGGVPERYAAPDSMFEQDFHEPSALPDGRGLLFAAHVPGKRIQRLCILRAGRQHTLLEIEGALLAWPRWSPTGQVVYERLLDGAGIWALPVSPATLTPTGKPFLVVANAGWLSIADDGTLACAVRRPAGTNRIEWFSRDGTSLGAIGPPERTGFAFSATPDGARIAYSRRDAPDVADIWLYDAGRQARTRLTLDPGFENLPSISPDGERVAYAAFPVGALDRPAARVILLRAMDGSRAADTLARDAMWPSFTPDGQSVVFLQMGTPPFTVRTLGLAGERTPRTLFIAANENVSQFRVSPDGRWIAYMSSESGRFEVYVRRYPSGEGRWQASTEGGKCPIWNAAGNRLAYLSASGDVVEVDFVAAEIPRFGTPRSLFPAMTPAPELDMWSEGSLQATADFSRFAHIRPIEAARPVPLLLQNWAHKAPAARR